MQRFDTQIAWNLKQIYIQNVFYEKLLIKYFIYSQFYPQLYAVDFLKYYTRRKL